MAEVTDDDREAARAVLAAQIEAWGHSDSLAAAAECHAVQRKPRETAEGTIKLGREALCSLGYCGDGNLPQLITRALGEAETKGRDGQADLEDELRSELGAFGHGLELGPANLGVT